MTNPHRATAVSTASTTRTAIAAADGSRQPQPPPEREPDRTADDWLALPWPVADADERRRLRREMVLRALI